MGIVLLPEDLFKKSDDTSEKAKVNINVRAAFIHVLGDLVQSLGVLVGSLIIKFKVRKLTSFSNFNHNQILVFYLFS